jgi:hypothetical protein
VIAVRVCKRSFLVVLAACAFVSAFACVQASAEVLQPWWGVTSTARPSKIRAGIAKDEIQQLKVDATGGEYALIEPKRLHELFEGRRTLGELLYTVLPYDASAATVQAALESKVYGAGNVQVSGGPGDAGGTKPYTITFTGELADQPLEPVVAEVVGLAHALGVVTPLSGGGESATVSVNQTGNPDGELVLSAENLGDAEANGETTPIVMTDALPPGLKAVAMEGLVDSRRKSTVVPVQCSVFAMVCAYEGKLRPYELLEVRVLVVVQPGASSEEVNEASASGGGAVAARSVRHAVAIGGGEDPFGVEDYGVTAEEADGEIDTQAGSHPFQLTTTLSLNQTGEKLSEGESPLGPQPAGALPKDLRFDLPPGLIGNPTPFPQCTDAQFAKLLSGGLANECPPQTALGVATITYNEAGILGMRTEQYPIFNLVPRAGEPARFAFNVLTSTVMLDTSVRTGGDYGVTVDVDNIPQIAGLLASRVTFWGVPGDKRHDGQRGWGCVDVAVKEEGVPCNPTEPQNPPPFLSLPTSCTGPLQTSVTADSWKQPALLVGPFGTSEPMAALDGCNHLPFAPSVSVTPDISDGSSSTGLAVKVHVPQAATLNPSGISESTLRNTTVTLPPGVTINPAGADGLEACSDAQIGFLPQESQGEELHFTPGLPSCPNGSKIATVKIRTPLLPNPLEGAVYLATQDENPLHTLVAMYLVAQDPVSGVVVKLPGKVVPDPVTGQLVSTFTNTPQLPFEELEIHFFGGERAPLSTPPSCGTYTTDAAFAPWSGEPEVSALSSFDIASGPGGSACQSPLPFTPSLTAGSTNLQTGAFSPFTMTMSRADGNQNLQAIQLHMPPGLLGTLATVELCREPQASEGLCGPNSLIGETVVSVGVGGSPFAVRGGRVYITGPYEGAPFGLSIVNPAKAGPFDLGEGPCDCVLVRAKLEIDPITAALTVTTDNSGPHKIPTILDGIPLQIQHVNVVVNRPNFTFNPTNCSPMAITGALTSSEGATDSLSVPFQVTNCAVLGFKPGFHVSTAGKTSRKKGASLSVKLTYPKAAFGSQANIKSVKVDLPKQLPSRLTTLQKACTAAQFQTNPAGCPAASMVGHATAITPLIPVPLTGPAYFVSYGGAKFPELVIVLQGYGVTLDLHGETFINKAGITSSTFHTVPDAPVGSFELTLPQGPYSALAANGNLCKSTLKMPTAFVAQNGATIKQSTPIGVTGCPKKKAHKTIKHRAHAHGKKK